MSDEANEKTKIVPQFEAGLEVAIPIDASALAKAAKAKAIQHAKRKADLDEACEYAKMGAKIIKTKATLAAMLGKHAARLGIKDLGHGKLLSAAENADRTLEELDAIIQERLNQTPPVDPGVIIALYQLKRDFNKQLIETADRHLEAAREVAANPKDNSLSIPFPAGTPMTVAITNQPPNQPAKIESPKPPQ